MKPSANITTVVDDRGITVTEGVYIIPHVGSETQPFNITVTTMSLLAEIHPYFNSWFHWSRICYMVFDPHSSWTPSPNFIYKYLDPSQIFGPPHLLNL